MTWTVEGMVKFPRNQSYGVSHQALLAIDLRFATFCSSIESIMIVTRPDASLININLSALPTLLVEASLPSTTIPIEKYCIILCQYIINLYTGNRGTNLISLFPVTYILLAITVAPGNLVEISGGPAIARGWKTLRRPPLRSRWSGEATFF